MVQGINNITINGNAMDVNNDHILNNNNNDINDPDDIEHDIYILNDNNNVNNDPDDIKHDDNLNINNNDDVKDDIDMTPLSNPEILSDEQINQRKVPHYIQYFDDYDSLFIKSAMAAYKTEKMKELIRSPLYLNSKNILISIIKLSKMMVSDIMNIPIIGN